MANLPADVETFYLEELLDVCPSCVVYRHSEELFYNVDRAYDTMATALQLETSGIRDWNKSFQAAVASGIAAGHLANGCLHTRPTLGSRRLDQFSALCFDLLRLAELAIFLVLPPGFCFEVG